MKSPLKIIKAIWIICLSFVLLFCFFIFSVSVNLFSLYGKIPGLDILENPRNEIASEVYAADYVLLGKYFSGFNRSPVEAKDLPESIKSALIATEDVRFVKHSGIDLRGIASIPYYLLSGKKKGASTITQQLAKNLFEMRFSPEYTGPLNNILVIKVKEWIAAIRLEKAYTKDEILLMYLNTVDFGNNSLGIKSAAKTYFNTTPAQLKPEQSALLVGILKGPSYYSPRRHPDRALLRRNTVLSQMLKYDYITESEFESFKKIPVRLDFSPADEAAGMAPYFRAYIKNYLVKVCYEKGYNLYEDGLKIFTTIDSRMQQYAEDATTKHMKYLQKEFFAHWKGKVPWTDIYHKEIKGFIEKLARRSPRFIELKEEYGNDENAIWKEMKKPVKMKVFTWNGSKDTTLSPMDSIRYTMHFLHMGFMAMDPSNGFIKAWVGDIDYRFFKYDHVKQSRRQPGSTFKPIIYAYALEHGFTPCSTVYDVPVTFTIDGGKQWTPKNSHGGYSGLPITLKQALAQSVNTVSASLMQQFSPEAIADFAKGFGITSPLDPVPPLCLGTSDVTVYELTEAYSVFVNNGIRIDPVFITRIEDKDGNVIFQPESVEPTHVISEESAYAMVQMLKGTTEEQSGTAVSLKSTYKLPYEVGGKTGTTQNSSDGWFMGITPGLVCGTWVGGEHRSIRFRTMTLGQGAKMALPIFGYFMQKVYNDKTLGIATYDFVKPADVNVETNCPQVDSLYYLERDSTSVLPDSNTYIPYPGFDPNMDDPNQ
ncbi:MAG TPA: transglycosylase domain-containing protein [Cytophagaceae bacterium]|jgi:penicillin-binding protein 1A|nr:transglycosylase domain-containing protein [Cytophagaceae bacterium]